MVQHGPRMHMGLGVVLEAQASHPAQEKSVRALAAMRFLPKT